LGGGFPASCTIEGGGGPSPHPVAVVARLLGQALEQGHPRSRGAIFGLLEEGLGGMGETFVRLAADILHEEVSLRDSREAGMRLLAMAWEVRRPSGGDGPAALHLLALIYLEGLGVEQNDGYALLCLEKASPCTCPCSSSSSSSPPRCPPVF
jgi:TPR repeat protein